MTISSRRASPQHDIPEDLFIRFKSIIYENYDGHERFYRLLPPSAPIKWRAVAKPLTPGHLRAHLAGRAVYGAEGRPAAGLCVPDLDHVLGPDGSISAHALRRIRATAAVLGEHAVYLRSSGSGNIHVWQRTTRIPTAVRDVWFEMRLREVDPDLVVGSGEIELFPGSRNHRLPLGLGSGVLERDSLIEGMDWLAELSRADQVRSLVEQPILTPPGLSTAYEILAERAPSRRPAVRAAGALPDGIPSSTATEYHANVARWLTEGPQSGEHNLALGGLVLYYRLAGLAGDEIRRRLREWQETVATGCNEWKARGGRRRCFAHIDRWITYYEREFVPSARQADDKPTGVPISDVRLGLALFPRDVMMQRAFFAFCLHVRYRLDRGWYPDCVMPIHARMRWASFSSSRYEELRDTLQTHGICTLVEPAVRGLASARYRIALLPAEGERVQTWREGVIEACESDWCRLREHFTTDQVRYHFAQSRLRIPLRADPAD